MPIDTVTVYGLTYTVKHVTYGRYRPATLEEPEEYPEIEIISIEPADDDEYNQAILNDEISADWIDSDELQELITQKIKELDE